MHGVLWVPDTIYKVPGIDISTSILWSRGPIAEENPDFFYLSDFIQHVFSEVPPLRKKASCSGGKNEEGLWVRKAWVWVPLSSDVSLYPYLPLRAWRWTKSMRTLQLLGWPHYANLHVPVKRTLKGRVTSHSSPTHSSTNNSVLVTPPSEKPGEGLLTTQHKTNPQKTEKKQRKEGQGTRGKGSKFLWDF